MKMFLVLLFAFVSFNASAQILGIGKKKDPEGLQYAKTEISETDLWTTIKNPKGNALAVGDNSNKNGICLLYNRYFGYVGGDDSVKYSNEEYDDTAEIGKHGTVVGHNKMKHKHDGHKIITEIDCWKFKQEKKHRK